MNKSGVFDGDGASAIGLAPDTHMKASLRVRTFQNVRMKCRNNRSISAAAGGLLPIVKREKCYDTLAEAA